MSAQLVQKLLKLTDIDVFRHFTVRLLQISLVLIQGQLIEEGEG